MVTGLGDGWQDGKRANRVNAGAWDIELDRAAAHCVSIEDRLAQ